MEQWEYLTLFLEARVQDKDMRQYIETRFNKKPKKFSPESMIPRLNQLGEQGWEMIHIEAVGRVGRQENVQDDPYAWSNTYFCVFKRPKPASSIYSASIEPPANTNATTDGETEG